MNKRPIQVNQVSSTTAPEYEDKKDIIDSDENKSDTDEEGERIVGEINNCQCPRCREEPIAITDSDSDGDNELPDIPEIRLYGENGQLLI